MLRSTRDAGRPQAIVRDRGPCGGRPHCTVHCPRASTPPRTLGPPACGFCRAPPRPGTWPGPHTSEHLICPLTGQSFISASTIQRERIQLIQAGMCCWAPDGGKGTSRLDASTPRTVSRLRGGNGRWHLRRHTWGLFSKASETRREDPSVSANTPRVVRTRGGRVEHPAARLLTGRRTPEPP